MNTDEIQIKFVCECGKSFETQVKLSHHKTHCKVFQANKKQREIEEREARRLPNGLFKCDNPDCTNEHDGSYGSGRFCCKKCKDHFVSLTGTKTAKKNGTRKCNFNKKPAPYGTWKCNECNLIFHTRAKLFEHNKIFHSERVGISTWNKGLTKETSVSISIASKKISAGVKRAYEEGRLTGKCKDPQKEAERRNKISQTAKKYGKSGGKRPKSGRGKQGWYKGYWCDSSWELAWVIFNIDHNIQFKRYSGYFEYQFNGAKHKYYPDFELEDGTIVEIKGAEKLKQWKAKLEQFPQDKQLQVIGKNEINKYLKYVTEKYGDDFIKLYEK